MPGFPAFENAERAFENGLFAEALDGYNAFLLDAYDGHFADAALFKIGKIFRLTGREDDALAVFSRLRREFPESSSGFPMPCWRCLHPPSMKVDRFPGGCHQRNRFYRICRLSTLQLTPFFLDCRRCL
jgi:hypothetical protein